jgi:hypothetical protein
MPFAENLVEAAARQEDYCQGHRAGPGRAAAESPRSCPLPAQAPLLDQTRLGDALNNTNRAINGVATLICVIVVLQLAWDIVQLILNHYRQRAAAMK